MDENDTRLDIFARAALVSTITFWGAYAVVQLIVNAKLLGAGHHLQLVPATMDLLQISVVFCALLNSGFVRKAQKPLTFLALFASIAGGSLAVYLSTYLLAAINDIWSRFDFLINKQVSIAIFMSLAYVGMVLLFLLAEMIVKWFDNR